MSSASPWPAAVLFDFDGVIVNSEPLHFLAFQDVLKAEGIHITEQEYYRELIGFDDKGAFRHLFQVHKRPLDANTFQRLMNAKSETMRSYITRRQYTALPGVDELIRGLRPHYPLAICSGALRDEIEAMLVGIDLRDCFSVIIAAEDVTIGKPDPQGYLMTTDLIGKKIEKKLTPADVLIIEDAPSVIRSMRQAGFPVLAVATSYPLEKLADANWQVPSLRVEEIKKHLPNLKISV